MSAIKTNATLSLRVQGSIVVYHDNDKVEITKALLQGINPNILILDVKVSEGTGPMKGTDRKFTYEMADNVRKYTEVTLQYPDGKLETIKIV